MLSPCRGKNRAGAAKGRSPPDFWLVLSCAVAERMSCLGWLQSSGGWELVRNCFGPAAAPPHVRSPPILLKNSCLIAVPLADSILLINDGGIGDDGNEAGSAGGLVLRVFAGRSRSSQSLGAVDASLISADVQKQNSSNPDDWAAREIDPADAPRVVREYLDTLDDEAFGAATTAKPKCTAHADPASLWTVARKGSAFFAYSDNYLIDTDHGIIVDVDASRSNKTAEVGAMRKMLDRTEERFRVKPRLDRR